ncbi:CDP-alcohol phosphatidyltransferase family protein, partial [Ralstonia sp.]
MPAFNRRKKRFTASNVMHLRPLRHNQPRSDDDDLEIVRPRRRGIYLLPNAFTTAALFSGFFAIVQAMNLNFETAAIAIFAAMVLDGMDGRIARITNTQSAFGEQYDSLSDMCSFGVAPALVMYEWI